MKIKDIVEEIIDNRGKNAPYFVEKGIPVIDNFMINNKFYPDLNAVRRYIDENVYENFVRKYNVENDILITLVGNGYGNTTLSPTCKSIILQNTIGIRCNDKCFNKYLYYYLQKNIKMIKDLNRGAAQPSVKVSDFLDLEIDLPALEEQQKIVDILSPIDEKIELNNKINKTLEDISQLIYKQWFMDFEFPNEYGNPYKSSDGRMVYNEDLDKEIPDGWELVCLDDVTIDFDSKRKPIAKNDRSSLNNIYPYYGASSVIDYVDNYIFDGRYVLMGEDGTVVTKEGHPILQYVEGKFWVNNHTHVLQGKNNFSNELIFTILKNENVENIVTGAVQPKINKTNMNSIKVLKPNNEILEKINDILICNYEKYFLIKNENDLLLKKKKILLEKYFGGN